MKTYWLWLALLTVGVIVAAVLMIRRAAKRSGASAAPADGMSKPREASCATQAQIDGYIALCHAQAQQQAEIGWRICFERIAPACQQLLGLRRSPSENLADRVAEVLDRVTGLTKDGFAVAEIPPAAVDEAAIRKNCAGLTQAEMADSIMLLRRKMNSLPLDYRALVTALGGALCSIRQAQRADVQSLPASLTALDGTLQKHGVLALYSDAAEIRASHALYIRCFADVADGEEIPGLFCRTAEGELTCISRFGGTRRRDDA